MAHQLTYGWRGHTHTSRFMFAIVFAYTLLPLHGVRAGDRVLGGESGAARKLLRSRPARRPESGGLGQTLGLGRPTPGWLPA